jgi:hypothetical protein
MLLKTVWSNDSDRWSKELANALELHRWELFSNRSNTSLDIGTVNLVAKFLKDWIDNNGYIVIGGYK